MSDSGPARMDWASRVPRAKVRRLYEGDAQGMLDVERLEEVGHGIYCRVREDELVAGILRLAPHLSARGA